MHKKLMLACMAIAAFAAFVIAPSASAANLTENGVTIKAGASITGHSNETKFTASGNTVTCTSGHMSGVVTKDENGTIAGEIAAGNPVFSGTGTGGDCTSEGLGPVKPTVNSKLCLHIAKGTDLATIDGCLVFVEGEFIKVTTGLSFTLNITNLGLSCRYGAGEVRGTVATGSSDATITVQAQRVTIESGTIFCPSEGELDMQFTLTTTDGTTLTFS